MVIGWLVLWSGIAAGALGVFLGSYVLIGIGLAVMVVGIAHLILMKRAESYERALPAYQQWDARYIPPVRNRIVLALYFIGVIGQVVALVYKVSRL
jgi:hypothetical protein